MNTQILGDSSKESAILLNQVEKLCKIGTWELNLINNTLHWSNGVYRMLDFEPNEIKLTFEFGSKVVHPEDRDRALKHAEEAILEGKEYNIQKRLLGKNKIIHVNSKATVYFENERPVKLIGIFQDISDSIDKSKQLSVESEFNRLLIEKLPSTFYMLNQKGEFLKWNKHFESHSGYSFDEIFKMKPSDFFDEEDAKRINKHIQIAFKEGYTEVDALLKTKSGDQIPYLFTAARINYHGEDCIFGLGYDLAEVKNLQNDLQRILDYSLDIMCAIDQKGNFIRVSAASKKVLGYEPKEMIGKNFRNFICEEFLEESNQRIKAIAKGVEINNFSNRYFHKNGKTVPLIWSVYWDEELQLIHCVAKDATEIVESQKKLEKSNERYQLINQATKDAIYEWDILKDEMYFGQSFEYNFGYQFHKKAISLKKIMQFIHPNDFEYVNHSLEQFLADKEKKRWESAYRFQNADGSYAHVEEVGLVKRDKNGKAVQMIGVLRDISETQKLRSLLDNASQMANVGGWEVDMHSKTHRWSKVARQIFGVDDDFQPDFESTIQFYRADYRPMVEQAVQKAIENKESFDFEAPILTKDGTEKWVRSNGAAEFVGDHCVRLYGSTQDISERKYIAIELEQYVKQLAISNAELEQFAYVASHDLQEPLRMITGFMSLLQEKYKGQLDDKAQKYIHFATDGAKRMRQIILDLLDFSRLSNASGELCEIDLNLLMKDVKVLHKKHIAEKRAKITWDKLPKIKAFHSPVLRLFQNLINNAIKYSKSEEKPIIHVGAEDNDKEWKFTISDNGIGIPKEFHEKIFIIFQRLHGKTQYKGTGIGLSIVKKIVENLGGRIWLESEENVGTTFYFTIPKAVKENV